jgi:eukaryotic-like serine/threonine-protein kinase
MNAILREDPPELPATVPPALQSIVLHCLEKEPHRRYQSAQDLAFALRALSGSAIVSAPSVVAVKSRRSMLPIAGLAAAAAVAVYAVVGLLVAPRGANLGTYRYTPVASGATAQGNPAWSPDGKSIAYVKGNPGALDSLMVRSLDAMLPVTVARADVNGAPFWSPDGTRLFFVARDGIFSVSRAGGGQQQLMKGSFAAAALSPDGRTLIAWLIRQGDEARALPKLWISSPPGATPRPYEPVPWTRIGSAQPIYLRFSPDGRQIAVSETADGAELWLLPFPDGHGKPRRVFPSPLGGFAPAISWMPGGRRLVISFAEPFKMTQLWIGDTASGSLVPITAGESRLVDPAVSPDGRRIAYDGVSSDSDLVQIPLENGMIRTLLATSRDESAAAWSPKTSQFAYVTSRNGRPEIWEQSVQEGWERPVVTQHDFAEDNLGFFSLEFSPDGERLGYMRMSNKHLAVIWISPAAGGQPVQVSSDDDFAFGPSWSPDGNSVVYMSLKHGLVKAVPGDSQPPVKVPGGDCVFTPKWSPDGQWIACPEGGHIRLLSPDGKMSRTFGSRRGMVAWSHDSRVLYTLGQDQSQWLLVSIDVKNGTEKTIVTLGPEQNFWAGNTNASMITLSPDGKSVTATSTRLQSDVWLLEGFPQPYGWWERLLWWRGN